MLGSAFLLDRYNKNLTKITPYPFEFTAPLLDKNIEFAPIVIIGDRLSKRLSSFIPELTEKLSVKLSKAIKIKTFAQDGENIHRSLQKLKELSKMPLIIIYMGNNDESYERLYQFKDAGLVKRNFKLFDNDYAKTGMLIAPFLSRFIYNPTSRVELGPHTKHFDKELSDARIQNMWSINFRLYEAALNEMFNLGKRKGSIIIPITSPLNYRTLPKRSCYGAIDQDGSKDLKALQKLIKSGRYRDAEILSKDLILLHPSHSAVLHGHAQVMLKTGKQKQAIKYFKQAIAFDCGNKYGNPVYNSILKKYADKYNITYFDFEEMINKNIAQAGVFQDEVYPQDIYYQNLIDALADRIKNLLKL